MDFLTTDADYTNYNNYHRLRGLTGLFQTTD